MLPFSCGITSSEGTAGGLLLLALMAIAEQGGSCIGDRVRSARLAANLHATDVARRARFSTERLREIEGGSSLSTIELDAVASALGVGVDELLRPADESLDVWLRLGDGTTVTTREAVRALARFTAEYEFLLSLER